MKKLLTTILLAVLTMSVAHAQRSIPPRNSFRDYRPDGEYRLWTFMKRDSTIGRLTSIAVGGSEINGAETFRIREQLSLDYTRAEGDLKLTATGETFFTVNGAFAGCDITRQVNDQQGKVSLRRQGDRLVGSIDRGGSKTAQEIGFPSDGFAIDYDMPDQYELYFAMHGIKVGDAIDDSIFVPTDLGVTYLRGTVTGWTWQQLWQGVFDSVFVVEMTAPVPQELFINRDLWLRKVNIPNQDMRVYLDAVRAPVKAAEPGKPAAFKIHFGNLARNYIIYLLVGLIGMVLFVGKLIRRPAPSIGLLAGVFVTAVLLWAIAHFSNPGTSAAGHYFTLYLPALLFYLSLLGLLWVFRTPFRLQGRQFVGMGAAVGAGVGIGIAGYVDVVVSPDQALAFGQILTILLYVGGGALLGWAYSQSRRLLLAMYVGVGAVGAVLATIEFKAAGADAGLQTLLVGIAAALFLLIALMLARKGATPPK